MRKVLFQPDKDSKAREIGEVTTEENGQLTITWNNKTYQRDPLVDFVRNIENQ